MDLSERCTLLEKISEAQVIGNSEEHDELLHTFADKIANNILLSSDPAKTPLHIVSVFDSMLKT